MGASESSVTILLLASCTTQEIIHQSPCDGNCGTYFDVVYENQVLTPNSNGYFHCVWGVAFFNEPPSGAEGDAGAMYLQLNDSNITTMSLSFIVSNQNTYHEGQMWTDSRIIEITNGTGSGDYITVAHNTDWTLGLKKPLTTMPVADGYLYLVASGGATNNTYTAGKFLIKLYGYAA